MDEINPEFQERIRAIKNDNELRAKVNFALHNWIGTRYTVMVWLGIVLTNLYRCGHYNYNKLKLYFIKWPNLEWQKNI